MSRKRPAPPMIATHTAAYTLRLPKAMRDEFFRLCEQREVWPSEVTRQLIEIWIKRMRERRQ